MSNKKVRIITTMVYEYEVDESTKISHEVGHSLMANSEPTRSYQTGLITLRDMSIESGTPGFKILGEAEDFGL